MTTATAAPVSAPAAVKIEMVPDKSCVNSQRYAAIDPKAPISQIYLKRDYNGGAMPHSITLTLEA